MRLTRGRYETAMKTFTQTLEAEGWRFLHLIDITVAPQVRPQGDPCKEYIVSAAFQRRPVERIIQLPDEIARRLTETHKQFRMVE